MKPIQMKVAKMLIGMMQIGKASEEELRAVKALAYWEEVLYPLMDWVMRQWRETRTVNPKLTIKKGISLLGKIPITKRVQMAQIDQDTKKDTH